MFSGLQSNFSMFCYFLTFPLFFLQCHVHWYSFLSNLFSQYPKPLLSQSSTKCWSKNNSVPFVTQATMSINSLSKQYENVSQVLTLQFTVANCWTGLNLSASFTDFSGFGNSVPKPGRLEFLFFSYPLQSSAQRWPWSLIGIR